MGTRLRSALALSFITLAACGDDHAGPDGSVDSGTAHDGAVDMRAPDGGSCPAGFGGPMCLLMDPSLSGLVPSMGTLGPVFDPATQTYTVALPAGASAATLTPTVAYPAHATITVDGVTVASGTASAPIDVGTARARVVHVVVRADGGPLRGYDVVVSNIAYIKASNTDLDDWFGRVVALSADGSTLAVGALNEDSSARGVGGDQSSNTTDGAGAVYVFVRCGGTWTQQAYLKASNTEPAGTSDPGDGFGTSVALSADGSTLAVGATWEDSIARGVDGDQSDNSAPYAGAVYVFTRTGSTWAQGAYVKASNTDAVLPFGDNFGVDVALSGDGATLAVGAWHEASRATGVNGDQTDSSENDVGAVYVYGRTGSTWAQEAYVKATYYTAGGVDTYSSANQFGYAVALSYDGSTLAVGAPREHSTATGIDGDPTDAILDASGAVYVYTRTSGVWSTGPYIKASNTGELDRFGWDVALSDDGRTLAVGAPGESSNARGVDGDQSNDDAPHSGAVYTFTHLGAAWMQTAYIKASNTGAETEFGAAVSLSSDGATLVAGSGGESSRAVGIDGDETDTSVPNAGAVYVFTRTGATWTQRSYVKASNPHGLTDLTVGDVFGVSVAISGDASTIAVGAFGEGSNATGIGGNQWDVSADGAGAVYVY